MDQSPTTLWVGDGRGDAGPDPRRKLEQRQRSLPCRGLVRNDHYELPQRRSGAVYLAFSRVAVVIWRHCSFVNKLRGPGGS